MTTTMLPPAPATGRRLRVPAAATYVLTGLPPAVVAFVVAVAGVSVSAGTLVIVLGVGVLALTLLAAQGFAVLERARLDALLGTRVPRPAYAPLRPGPVGAALSAGADPRRWLDLVHAIVGFPVAVATFAVVAGWSAAAVGGLGYPLWRWALPDGDGDHGLAWVLGLGAGTTADILVTTGAGLLAAVTLPFVVRGCAAAQSGLARAVLGAHPGD